MTGTPPEDPRRQPAKGSPFLRPPAVSVTKPAYDMKGIGPGVVRERLANRRETGWDRALSTLIAVEGGFAVGLFVVVAVWILTGRI